MQHSKNEIAITEVDQLANFGGRIVKLLTERISSGAMSAASLSVSLSGERLLEWTGGTTAFGDEGQQLTPDHLFYLTSISKALVFTAAATLIDEGLLELRDPVHKYLPALDAPGKRDILFVHLFTHSSGLPEFVDRDMELRKGHAPLSEFAAEAVRADLGFTPGTQLQYSNAGTHLLSRAVEVILDNSLPEILQERIFGPLGMRSSVLGWDDALDDRWVEAKSIKPSDWDHNSHYWRRIGAPWSGVHSTAADLQLLLETIAARGISPNGKRHFSKPLIELFSATDLAPVPSPSGRRWGLGWEVQTAERKSSLGALLPPGAFGHGGAAGTMMWVDPASEASFVLLTNGRKSGPQNEGSVLRRCCNLGAAWLC